MGCPAKDKKKFLGIIPYEPPHDWEVVCVSKFMSTSDDWIVHYVCKECKSSRKEHFVKDEELIRMGFDIEELRSNVFSDVFNEGWRK